MQWSGGPALHTRFHFGKYRGKRYDEIAASDPAYLQWIVRNPNSRKASSTAPSIGSMRRREAAETNPSGPAQFTEVWAHETLRRSSANVSWELLGRSARPICLTY